MLTSLFKYKIYCRINFVCFLMVPAVVLGQRKYRKLISFLTNEPTNPPGKPCNIFVADCSSTCLNELAG